MIKHYGQKAAAKHRHRRPTLALLKVGAQRSRSGELFLCSLECPALLCPDARRLIIAYALLLLTLCNRSGQAQSSQETSARSQALPTLLMGRVGEPSDEAIAEFSNAGMIGVRPHILTPTERPRVEAALASLPALHQRTLFNHLQVLAFVDGIPGEGTGLTSPAKREGMFNMTFRASLIEEDLSAFLTTKEQRIFTSDRSSVSVTIHGTGANALTYVLLHESSHVVDSACGISRNMPNQFNRNIWVDQHQMTPELSQNPATQNYFHRGPKFPVSRASDTYNQLAKTPFVSMYATAAANEDFAELVAWRELEQRFNSSFTIEVADTASGEKHIWHPLSFPAVRARFPLIDAMEATGAGCPKLN